MKAKLAALKDPLCEFKTVVDKQYDANELANRSNNLKGTLVSHKIGADVKGYDLKKPLTIPPVCVQAAYNVGVILGYVASLVNNDSFVTLGKDASDIGNALAQAIAYLTPEKGLVVDETSAKIADVCSQLFAEVAKQSGGISDMVPSVLKTDKIEKAAKKADNLAKPFMVMVGAFFEIAERGYRIKNISKNIPIDPQILLTDANKNQALRKKLLSVLPEDQRTGLPDGLNAVFFEQYKIKCNQYLEKIKVIDPEPFLHPKKPPKPDSKKETLLKTAQKFAAEKTKFVGDFSAFSDRINQLAQAMNPPEPEVIVASEPEVETQTPVPENSQTELPQTEVIVEPSAIETEAPQIVDAEIPSEILQGPTASETEVQEEKLNQEEEEPLDPILKVQKLLDKLESEKLALTEKIQASSDQIVQLNKEIEQLDVKLEDFKKDAVDPAVYPLEQKIIELKNSLAQFRIKHDDLTEAIKKKPTVKQLEEKIAALEKKQPQLNQLNSKIIGHELAMSDSSIVLEALGITLEQLNEYLKLQEEESSFLGQVGKFASNFIGFFSDDPAPQPAVNDYLQQKEKLIQNLNAKIRANKVTLNNLNVEKQALPSELEQLNYELNNLNTQIQVLEEKSKTLSELNVQLVSEQEKIASFEKQQAQLIIQKTELQRQLEALQHVQDEAKEILIKNNEMSDQEQKTETLIPTGDVPFTLGTDKNELLSTLSTQKLEEKLADVKERKKIVLSEIRSKIFDLFNLFEGNEVDQTENKIESSFEAIRKAISEYFDVRREYKEIKKALENSEKKSVNVVDPEVTMKGGYQPFWGQISSSNDTVNTKMDQQTIDPPELHVKNLP